MRAFPGPLAFLVPMSPRIMAAIKHGPTQAYADEYDRVNRRIDEAAAALAAESARRGFRALALAASERTDPVNIRGDFPHKTAATRAGLGWIGRHCQLVTCQIRPLGAPGHGVYRYGAALRAPGGRAIFAAAAAAVWRPARPGP